jgi:hypothetical protein
MNRKTVNALILSSCTAAAALVLALPLVHAADKPAPAAPAPAMAAAPTTQAAPMDANEKRFAEIPLLRKGRLELYEVQKMLQRDVIDPKGYRHEALDHVNQAIDLMTKEINEYKGDDNK